MTRTLFVFMLFPWLIFLGTITAMATTGSFSDVPVTEKAVIDAAEFAVEAKAMKMAGETTSAQTKMELLEILNAQQQVVSGMKYRLKVAVSLDGKEIMAEAVVWWQAWREPNPYILTSWSWVEPNIQN